MKFIYEKYLKNILKLKFLVLLLVFICMLPFINKRIEIGTARWFDFDAMKWSLYDAGFFLNNAMKYDTFNANVFNGLIKNRAFIWFLLFANHHKLELHFAVSLTWIVASIMVFFVSFKWTKKIIISFLFFLYVLFCPIAFFSLAPGVIYRDILFVQTLLITLSFVFLFCYEFLYNNKNIMLIIYGVFSGLCMFYIYFLTETGIVFIMANTSILILFLFYYILKNKVKKRMLFILIPLIIFLFGVISYKFINYRVWGSYVENIRTCGEAKRFINNIQDIEDENTSTLVWATQDQINKAYNASKSFQKNYKLKESLNSLCTSMQTKNKLDYYGDFLGWGLIVYMEKYKIPCPDFEKMLKNINDEIDVAFKEGILKKGKKIKLTKTLGRYTKKEINEEVIPLTFVSMKSLVTYESMIKGVFFAEESKDEKGEYIEFFNVKNGKNIDKNYWFVVTLIDVYKKVNTFLVYIFILILLFSIILFIKDLIKIKCNKTNSLSYLIYEKRNIYLIIMIMFLLFYILYLFSISWFSVFLPCNWPEEFKIPFVYNYASSGIAFMAFAFLFCISNIICFFENFIFKTDYYKKYKNEMMLFNKNE